MAQFARIDSQILVNRLILANRFRVPELNSFFANCASRGLKIANRRFEAIRANRSHVMKIYPNLLFLAFFVFKEFLAILTVFPFFPKELRGSASRRNPYLFGGFPCCFPNGKEKKIRVLELFLRIDSRESPRFALRITGLS